MDLIADSHVPKYAQIADIFRQRIARGVWAKGLRLPANEELAAEFGVSASPSARPSTCWRATASSKRSRAAAPSSPAR